MIRINGAEGEGGGQILRSSLALSMCTGQPVTLENIRAGRRKPGLMRQHLCCVQAAAQVCGAEVAGAEVSGQTLTFKPGKVIAGDYSFAVGTAGSAMLVLQTVLPALLLADASSTVLLEGGTHNAMAPTFHYVSEVFLPALARLGCRCSCEIERWGFFPAGGGRVRVCIEPVGDGWKKLDMSVPGRFLGASVLCAAAKIPWEIAEDESLSIVNAARFEVRERRAITVESTGPGNVAMLRLDYEGGSAMFTGFGELGVSRKKVAAGVYRPANGFFKSGAAVDEHLADQILLPMALAGGGRFVTVEPTSHTMTNISVIRRFIDVDFRLSEQADKNWLVTSE